MLQIPKFQTQKPKTFKKADRWYRFRRYINDFWNVLDTVSYIITFIAIALRFSSETLQWARRIYSFSLFMMCMRFLHFILIYRKVGVYVILIKEMVSIIYLGSRALVRRVIGPKGHWSKGSMVRNVRGSKVFKKSDKRAHVNSI